MFEIFGEYDPLNATSEEDENTDTESIGDAPMDIIYNVVVVVHFVVYRCTMFS